MSKLVEKVNELVEYQAGIDLWPSVKKFYSLRGNLNLGELVDTLSFHSRHVLTLAELSQLVYGSATEYARQKMPLWFGRDFEPSYYYTIELIVIAELFKYLIHRALNHVRNKHGSVEVISRES